MITAVGLAWLAFFSARLWFTCVDVARESMARSLRP